MCIQVTTTNTTTHAQLNPLHHLAKHLVIITLLECICKTLADPTGWTDTQAGVYILYIEHAQD